MSRWQEFGFPDLTGVPLQTALEGLFLAAMDRLKLVGSFSEKDDYYNEKLYQYLFKTGLVDYWTASRRIEDAINSFPYNGQVGTVEYDINFCTSDGIIIRDMNNVITDYLKEDIIERPVLRREEFLNGNYGFFTGNWLLQKYRQLNSVYCGVVPLVDRQHIQVGEDRTMSDAIDAMEDETYYWRNGYIGAGTFTRSQYTNSQMTETQYTVVKFVTVPEDPVYGFRKPGKMNLIVRPERPYGYFDSKDYATVNPWYEETASHFRESHFDPLGMDIKFGTPSVLYSKQMPEDIKPDDTVSLAYIRDLIRGSGANTKFYPGLINGKIHEVASGYDLQPLLTFDFREVLEFYDPVEDTEK